MRNCLIVWWCMITPSIEASWQTNEDNHDKGVFHWMHNNGGYYNPKQELRNAIEGDPTSYLGVFATERIEEGELLVSVPWNMLIEGNPARGLYGGLCCDVARRLSVELKNKENSKYASYVEYLWNQPESQLPCDWSESSKAFFIDIIGLNDDGTSMLPPGKDPFDHRDIWFDFCGGDPDDEVGAKAALFTYQRADDCLIIPAYDFYNHRNGKWQNAGTYHNGKKHFSKALKTIEKGEQIHISYNFCPMCGGRDTGYGTADIVANYGFVEPMQQRWHFLDKTIQFDLDDHYFEDGDTPSGKLVVIWDASLRPVSLRQVERTKTFFETQLRRLRSLSNVYWNETVVPDAFKDTPQSEQDTLWAFHNAYIVAMEAALQSLESGSYDYHGVGAIEDDYEEEAAEGIQSSEQSITIVVDPELFSSIDKPNHYDDLRVAKVYGTDSQVTCKIGAGLEWYEDRRPFKGNYLNITLYEYDGDWCSTRNDKFQECTSYRPYYYEHFVHGAASYVADVKRVLFVGGASAMLLYEILKYPNLELVVGMEWDFDATRRSAVYFETDPHFDNSLVEWWFGNLATSLRLLPDDYWGSFDLVLLDVLETEGGFPVKDDMNLLQVVSQLVKSSGVMAHNKPVLEEFSELFPFTAQAYYPCPEICGHAAVMGSAQADFFRADLVDHDVESYIFNVEDYETNRFRDYQMNESLLGGRAKVGFSSTLVSPTSTLFGVLDVVEIENSGLQLDQSFLGQISGLAQKVGFVPVDEPFLSKKTAFVPFVGGYIRIHKGKNNPKYWALDFSAWNNKVDQLKTLKEAVIDLAESKLLSSFRLTTGRLNFEQTGAANTATPETSRDLGQNEPVAFTMGQGQDDEENKLLTGEEIISKAFDDMVSLMEEEEEEEEEGIVAVVFCGHDQPCFGLELMKDSKSIKKGLVISACPGLDGVEGQAPSLTEMHQCERQIYNELSKSVEGADVEADDEFDMIVVDSSVPYAMLQILNSIVAMPRVRTDLFSESLVIMSFSFNEQEGALRKNFLDRYQKQTLVSETSHAEYVVTTNDNSKWNLAIVVSDDERGAEKLLSLGNKLSSVSVVLESVRGGRFPQEKKDLEHYAPVDYEHDLEPTSVQAIESIFQLEARSGSAELDVNKFVTYLEFTFTLVGLDAKIHVVTNSEVETVLFCTFSRGSTIVSWNNAKFVTINLFSYDVLSYLPVSFVKTLLIELGPEFNMVARDDIPRGQGSLVSFSN